MPEQPAIPGRAEDALTVVIIDDRRTNRAIYSRLAMSTGTAVRVVPFDDSRTALEWLLDNIVDLVITDYKMPDLTGADLIRAVRKTAPNSEVPALVITAYGDRDFKVSALEAGATDFLTSPIDPQEFQTRVRNLLRLGQQQRVLRDHASELARELTASEAKRIRAIRQSRRDLAQVIDTVPAMISAADRGGRLIFVNAYQAQLAGRDVAALLGSDEALFGIAHHRSGQSLNEQVFETGAALPSFEEEVIASDGSRHWMLTTKAPLFDEAGEVSGVLTTSTDITARRDAERRLREISRKDALTGVSSRGWFMREMQAALARSRRGDNGFALHFLDIDRFKLVNDGLGHHVGDQLLREITARLVAVVGRDATVGRLGGDEFGILQTALSSSEEAMDFAAEMLDAISRPMVIDGQTVDVSASIGIAVCPRDGRVVEELLRSADLAMYAVKISGRHGYRLCGDGLAERAAEDRDLEHDLSYALARKQLLLHYQPMLSVETGAIVGAEALLRWNRSGWGVVIPAGFLPVAERCGLVGPISEWVVHAVTEQLATWQRSGDPVMPISINISPSQARRPDLAEAILGTAEAAGIDPSFLMVELTEANIELGEETMLACLARLRRHGVGVCVDNFGPRELSLWTLQSASVSRIKLDISVVHALEAADDAIEMIERAARYARALGAEMAAIGVETPDQLKRVRQFGCDIVQGALVSRPIEPNAFRRMLNLRVPIPGIELN